MKKPVSAMLLAVFVLACTAFTVAAPTPAPDAAVLKRASAWLEMLQQGKADRSELTPAVDSELTDVVLKSMASKLGPLGTPKKFEQVQSGTKDGSTYYAYDVTFKSGDMLEYIFALDSSGKISGIRFSAAQ